MAWSTPAAPITGQLITAGFWQAQITDNLTILKTSIDDNGHQQWNTGYIAANYTATLTDDVILADATAAAFQITLPTGAFTAKRYEIKKIDATANAVVIGASDLIDQLTSYSLVVQFQSVTIQRVPFSSSWWIV